MMFYGQEMLSYMPAPPILVDTRRKPAVELPPNCPRCDSSNTKFCYYNNYSLSQPRYFCKGCRRYWTKGGSLRNVPVGGGCRKNRRTRLARLSAERFAAGESNYGCRRVKPSSVRPDLLLDDPTASSCYSGGIPTVSSATESAPGGADIDLALVYTKFLNQRAELDSGFPEPEVPMEADESLIDLSGIVDSAYPMASQLEQQSGESGFQRATPDMIPETQMSNEFLPSAGETSLYPDPGFGVPLMPPTTDIFWSNHCSTAPWPWQAPQGLGIGTLEEGHLLPHTSSLISNWNTFSSSSCQAFP